MGSRAVTVLIAFEAGARTERREENGIAHFLEHLVFKGGQAYPTHREINQGAERLGARLNAFTSHDMVAFRISCRGTAVAEALDLLTDFVGRPRLDPSDIDSERGVVIQEIARAHDQPEDLADELVDRAAFADHPLGRPVLGTEESLRGLDREAVMAFRDRHWSGGHGGLFLVGDLSALPDEPALDELVERLPPLAERQPVEPSPPWDPSVLVEPHDSGQSQLRLLYRVDIDPTDRQARAALRVYSTLLGGSKGSLLFDEIREQRGLAYSVYALDHSFGDGALVQLAAGLQADRCLEGYERMRDAVSRLADGGLEREHVGRARTYAAGRLVVSLESTTAAAEHIAEEAVLFVEVPSVEETVATLDAVTYDKVREVARAVHPEPAVACVGPQTAQDFT